MSGESPILAVLALVAFSLLILFTGGVVYLTLVDWRDRRRRDQERRGR